MKGAGRSENDWRRDELREMMNFFYLELLSHRDNLEQLFSN